MIRRALMLACLWLPVAHASVYDDIAQLEAEKARRFASNAPEAARSEDARIPPAIKPGKPVRPYRLLDGRQINLNDYTLVLFMQSRCPYCQQFDPLLAQLASQTGFKVFAYTLDGQGDRAFPNAIPAPASVVERFFGTGMQVVTPTLYLVEVNTLKTYPLTQGMTSAEDVLARLNANLMASHQ